MKTELSEALPLQTHYVAGLLIVWWTEQRT